MVNSTEMGIMFVSVVAHTFSQWTSLVTVLHMGTQRPMDEWSLSFEEVSFSLFDLVFPSA